MFVTWNVIKRQLDILFFILSQSLCITSKYIDFPATHFNSPSTNCSSKIVYIYPFFLFTKCILVVVKNICIFAEPQNNTKSSPGRSLMVSSIDWILRKCTSDFCLPNENEITESLNKIWKLFSTQNNKQQLQEVRLIINSSNTEIHFIRKLAVHCHVKHALPKMKDK